MKETGRFSTTAENARRSAAGAKYESQGKRRAKRGASPLDQVRITSELGFALKVLVLGFLCATSVSSVSLWCVFARNSSTTEDTEVAQRRARSRLLVQESFSYWSTERVHAGCHLESSESPAFTL